MVEIRWNNCFLCLNDLPSQNGNTEEDRGQQNRTEVNKSEVNTVSRNFKAQPVLLLNYLLTNKFDKHSGVIKDIKQLLEEKEIGGYGVNFCEKCEGQVRRVSELHRELEVVQMKLVNVLKAVKKTVLQNSKTGGRGGINMAREIFEQWLREQEVDYAGEDGNEEEKTRLKEQRRILRTLEAFQAAVIENDKDSMDIPLVFLERCTTFGTQPSKQLLRFPEVTAKTEEVVMHIEDSMDTPMSPDHEDFNPATELEGPMIRTHPPPPESISTSTAPLQMDEKSNPFQLKKMELRVSKRPPRHHYSIPPSFQRKPHSVLRNTPKHISHLFYCCALCPFTTRSLHSLEEHLQNHETETASKEDHQPPPFQCDLCPDLTFHLEQSSELHKLTHTGQYAILCEPCNSWENPVTFKDHMTSHLEKIFPCPNCSYCAATRNSYIRHLIEHHLTTNSLKCDICGVPSSGKQKFLEHYYQVHQAIDKLVCGVEGCPREFLNPESLVHHKRVHTDRFRCSHCDKRFSSKLHLEEHVSAVNKEKPCKCDQCDASFASRGVLHRHKVKDHGVPRVKCDFCVLTFPGQAQLTVHRRLHTGEGFPCEHPGCGKVYGNRARLEQHRIHHSSEKNFICDLCGAALKTKFQLKKHKLTHAGEAAKKYKCPECGRAFLFRTYLTSHLEVHKGDRSHLCEACGKGFNQGATLHKHKKRCFLGPAAPPAVQKGREDDIK